MMEIKSYSHPYTVVESDSVTEAMQALTRSEMPFFLVDRNVADLYHRQISSALPSDRIYRIEAAEEAKSYERLAPVFNWLLGSRCQRRSHVVVIGGGVVQDIGCFVASVLFRGIRWTLLPTTLLAQCDSCIGSKSCLNMSRFKNQLGTFYPPHEVRLVFEFLGTLTQEELLSGMGEAIKLHLIDSEESVQRIQQKLAAWHNGTQAVREIVWDSLRIKKRFIEEDEFDRGIRNLLNYGHTCAHAFESATRYAIPHGIAVSLGVACATYFSEKLGMLPDGYSRRLREWLRPYFGGHRETLRRVELSAVLEAMKLDKKNVGDQITFILTRGAGRMEKGRLDVQRVQAMLRDSLEDL